MRCTRAWKVVLLVAQDALVSPRKERFGILDQVGGKVPTFQSGDWTSLLLEVAVSAELIPVLLGTGGGTPTTMRPSGSHGQWLGFKLENCLQ